MMNWFVKLANRNHLPQEFKKQFHHEIIKTNLRVGTIFLYFTAAFQLVNILHITLFETERIPTFPGSMYLGLYIFLFIISCIYLIRVNFIKHDIAKNARQIEILIYCYLAMLLFWATTISLLDLRNTENINVHLYVMIAVAVAPYINPKVAIPFFIVDFIYLVVCFPLFQRTKVDNMGNVLNATIVLAFCIVITTLRYYERISNFKQKQTIVKQNKVIKDRNTELKKLAITDSLSGLYNRRLLDDALTDKWNECFNMQTNFGFIMLDIDNFKSVNDTLGHLCGDSCISTIGDIIRECTDGTEAMSFRYGGEEFAILTSGCSVEEIEKLSELIRLKMEYSPIICAEEGTVAYITVTIGFCCEVPRKDSNYFEYISMADAALRIGKQKGKNQVQKCEWDKNKMVMYE